MSLTSDPPDALHKRPPTILVVDHQPDSLGILIEYLTHFGFTSIVAPDGETALEKAQSDRPELILLDVVMPKMDGFETCRRLKSDESLRDIPVIFITTPTERVEKARGFQVGGVGYVTKPFEYEEVVARIKTHLTLSAIQKELKAQNTRLQQKVAERNEIEMALRETAEALRKSEERLELALKGADLGLWDYNLQTGEAFVNQRRAEMVGYSLDEVEPHITWWGKQVHPDDFDGIRKAFNAHVKGRTPSYESEHRLRHKSGQYIWIFARGKVMEWDKQGNPVRLVGTALDITERKRNEEALRKAHQELERRIEERTSELVSVNRQLEQEIAQRKGVEEGLQKSEQMLKTILSMSPVAISLSTERIFQWVNDAWVKMFGFEAESEYIGKEARILYPNDEEYHRVGVLYQHLREGILAKIDAKMKRRNGEVFDAHLRMSDFDPHDPTKGTVVAISDVSERKHMEETLRESEEKYRTLFESGTEGFFLLTDVFLDCNDQACRVWGCAKEDIIGHSPVEFSPPFQPDGRSSEEAARGYIEAAMGGTPQRFFWKHLRQDGLLIDTEISLKSLIVGHRQVLLATMADITDRKKAEEGLRKSEEKLKSILRAVPVGIGVVVNRVIKEGNDYFCEMVGYSREELLDANSRLVYATEEDFEFVGREKYRQIAAMGRGTVETRWRRKDGEVITVLLSSSPIDPGDISLGVTFTALDITERKRAEEALRTSEEKYRTLFEESFDGLFITSPGGKILDMNKKGVAIFGYDTKEEIMKLDLERDVYAHPPDRKRILAMVNAQGSAEYEVVVKKKSGEEMITQCALTAVKDERGVITTYRGIIRDITERKQMEQALTVREQEYRTLVENIPALIVRYDTDLRRIYVNPAWEEASGLSAADVINVPATDIPKVPFPVNVEYLEKLRHVLETGTPQEIEFKWVNARGVTLLLDYVIVPEYGRDGKMVSLLAVGHDITERKTAEKALLESERRYRAVVDNLHIGISVINRKMEIVAINPFFSAYYPNVRPGMGQVCYAVYNDPPNSSPCSYCPCVLTFQDGEVHECETETPTGGKIRNYRIISCPVRDASGEVQLVIELVEDVTERRSLHAQLAQAQKMEAIGTLAGGVAHDFNNLLTVVQGFSELLLSDKDPKDSDYADLQKVFHAAKSGADLVKRLLMFSRKSEPKPVPVNLNKQIVDVEKLLRRTIPKMVAIHLDLSADLAEIYADPSQVEQVLMNLAVNARDAMPDTGKLTITTQAVKLDEEYCKLHVEAIPGEYVLMEVSDTGHGMDKETVEHIFEPFFTTKEMGRGTGLGLAMVYGLVKQHNGHITVYSEVGKGTTFRVYLPAIPTEEEPAVEDSGVMPAFGTETVLLVDDEEFVRELGARMLTKHGYTVLQAENGRDALDLFKKERSQISLVILDLIMPEMGGTECLKELLKIDPKVRVLVASGFSGDASVKEMIQMGVKGFVGKPFRVKELLRDVRKVLDEG